jgi:ketosteroid isomerase-like protein
VEGRPVSRPEDVAAVEAANAELYAAVEAGDLDRLGAVWVDDGLEGEALCVHPGWPPLRGRSAVLRSWAVIMAHTEYVQFFLTDVEVDVVGDAAVVGFSESTLTGVEDDDGSPLGFAGSRVVTTNVFRRVDGRWRLWAHHASPVLEPEDEEAGPAEAAGEEGDA